MSQYFNHTAKETGFLKCPKCGKNELRHYNYSISGLGSFDKFKCLSCNTHFQIPWEKVYIYDEEKIAVLDEVYECRWDCMPERLEAA